MGTERVILVQEKMCEYPGTSIILTGMKIVLQSSIT